MAPNKRRKAMKSWEDIAQEAQKLRDNSLADVNIVWSTERSIEQNVTRLPSEVLPSEASQITSLPFEELRESLISGAISAQATVMGFLQRAAIAQKLVSHSLGSLNSMSLVC
jgi:amidase